MDFQREQELRQTIADHEAAIKKARRELIIGRADEAWDSGDRERALIQLHNSMDRTGSVLVDYCRERGLTRDQAQELIASIRFPQD
jgi:hypothetical protein